MACKGLGEREKNVLTDGKFVNNFKMLFILVCGGSWGYIYYISGDSQVFKCLSRIIKIGFLYKEMFSVTYWVL